MAKPRTVRYDKRQIKHMHMGNDTCERCGNKLNKHSWVEITDEGVIYSCSLYPRED